MDRRDFMQTFTARGVLAAIPSSLIGVGASPSVPAPARQELTQTAGIKDMEIPEDRPRIGVVTIGGMGFSIARHSAWPVPYLARTIAIDTDAEELRQSKAQRQILLPRMLPFAQNFEMGITLSSDIRIQIEQAVCGLDMVLLVVGLGGSTGTAIAPLVAKLLGEQKILTLGYVALPFPYESEQRHRVAAAASNALAAEVDVLITVENSDIHGIVDPYASIDAVSVQGSNSFVALCRSIVNTVVRPDTLVSVDFDDLRHFILGTEGGCAFGHPLLTDPLQPWMPLARPWTIHSWVVIGCAEPQQRLCPSKQSRINSCSVSHGTSCFWSEVIWHRTPTFSTAVYPTHRRTAVTFVSPSWLAAFPIFRTKIIPTRGR